MDTHFLEGLENIVERDDKTETVLVEIKTIFCSTFSLFCDTFGSQPSLRNS